MVETVAVGSRSGNHSHLGEIEKSLAEDVAAGAERARDLAGMEPLGKRGKA